jgi:hypothetical protein
MFFFAAMGNLPMAIALAALALIGVIGDSIGILCRDVRNLTDHVWRISEELSKRKDKD